MVGIFLSGVFLAGVAFLGVAPFLGVAAFLAGVAFLGVAAAFLAGALPLEADLTRAGCERAGGKSQGSSTRRFLWACQAEWARR